MGGRLRPLTEKQRISSTKRIKNFLEKNYIPQGLLAKEIGLTGSYLSQMINGKKAFAKIHWDKINAYMKLKR